MVALKGVYSLTGTAITKAWAFAQAFCVGGDVVITAQKSRMAIFLLSQ